MIGAMRTWRVRQKAEGRAAPNRANSPQQLGREIARSGAGTDLTVRL